MNLVALAPVASVPMVPIHHWLIIQGHGGAPALNTSAGSILNQRFKHRIRMIKQVDNKSLLNAALNGCHGSRKAEKIPTNLILEHAGEGICVFVLATFCEVKVLKMSSLLLLYSACFR